MEEEARQRVLYSLSPLFISSVVKKRTNWIGVAIMRNRLESVVVMHVDFGYLCTDEREEEHKNELITRG
jgi:hypothetical protein